MSASGNFKVPLIELAGFFVPLGFNGPFILFQSVSDRIPKSGRKNDM